MRSNVPTTVWRGLARTVTGGIAGAVLATAALRPAAADAPPSAVGQWSPIYAWPTIAIHMSLLPNGKVLSFKALENPNPTTGKPGATDAYVVDIPPGQAPAGSTAVPNMQTNMFCSGHTFLPDGRLLVTGGRAAVQTYGVPDINIFDYRTNKWATTAGLPPADARWYGTATTLASGDALLLGGAINGTTDMNPLPQVWQVTDGSLRDLTNARLALPHTYPKTFVSPDGRIFQAGPEKETRFLDTSGTGAWTPGPSHKYGVRADGTAVMYDDGKVLVVAGGPTGKAPTNTAEIIDLNAPSSSWQYTGSMANPRRHANATLLPDGKVLVTGGSSSAAHNDGAGAVLAAELWDPATGGWTTMASMQVMRIYHSTAMLLPDGRVITAGQTAGTNGAKNNYNAQIYSPPYLFKGSRPTITSAPTGIKYGQTFSVSTPDAASVSKVRLIRLSSVTHSFNFNQRIETLGFTQAAGGLNVTVPSNRNLLPPGHYMLFILNGAGVPSVASILQVG